MQREPGITDTTFDRLDQSSVRPSSNTFSASVQVHPCTEAIHPEASPVLVQCKNYPSSATSATRLWPQVDTQS